MPVSTIVLRELRQLRQRRRASDWDQGQRRDHIGASFELRARRRSAHHGRADRKAQTAAGRDAAHPEHLRRGALRHRDRRRQWPATDLDHDAGPGADQPALLETIKRFVLGHSFAKVRVLLRDQARLSAGANRFIAMAHRLTSYLEIRIRATQYRELTAAYCIADDRAIVYRVRADRAEGIAGFNNPPIARQYLQEFDAVWQASVLEEREVRAVRG